MDEPILTLSLSFSIASVVGLLWNFAAMSSRFGALELKVNTMWDFMLRKAFSEVVTAGLATRNSPLAFTADALSRLDSIKDELRAFWIEHQHVPEREVLLDLERIFGDRLLMLVCVPCALSHGACLLIALSVAKQDPTVTLISARSKDGPRRTGSADRRAVD